MSCSLDIEYVQGGRPLDLGLEGNVTSTFVKANYLVTTQTLYFYNVHMATILFVAKQIL